MNYSLGHIDIPPLETERLLLRKLTPQDAADMFAYASDPEVAKTTTWEAHQTIGDSREFLRHVQYWYESGSPGPWGIIVKAEGRLIGTIGLNVTRHHSRAELGYAVGRPWWNQDLTTEAAQAVIRYGFDTLGLRRIEAHCLVDNLASERVMQKCGLTYEGTLRDYGFFKGEFRTLKVYAVVRDEGRGTRDEEFRVPSSEFRVGIVASTSSSSLVPRPSSLPITSLTPTDDARIQQVAEMLVAAFAGHTPAWPDLTAALAEVRESFGEGRLSRVALDERGNALGWVGGIRNYDGHAWELHPLAVRPDCQGQGIGRALVEDLEQLVAERGATTLYLGTDDEDRRTTLGGVDLYPDIWEHVARIQNPGRHPYAFYQRLGFTIVGLIPDANGPGKPDILMAKRVGTRRFAR